MRYLPGGYWNTVFGDDEAVAASVKRSGRNVGCKDGGGVLGIGGRWRSRSMKRGDAS